MEKNRVVNLLHYKAVRQDKFCPNILYPYAREVISDVVMKGGFPQLCLSPVNFDVLYQQENQQGETATVN